MGGYVYDPYSGTMQYDPFAAGDSGPTLPQTSSMPPMMAGASAPQPQQEYKPQVPDVMTGLNKVVDGFFGSSRNQSGSFDPNRVESIISKLPAEQQEEARLRFALAKEQADLFAKSRPNTSNFNLGNLFQGLGAVAYMTSKNPQVWSHSQAALNRIYQGNEDRERSGRAYDMAGMKAYSDVLGDLGDSAVDTMRKKREKRDAAVAGAADMVKKASPENRAYALEKAAEALEMHGYDVEAQQFRARAKQMMPDGTSSQAPATRPGQSGPMAMGSQPSYDGAEGTQRVKPPNPDDPALVTPQQTSANQSIYGGYEARIKQLLSERNRRQIVGIDTKDLDDEIDTIGKIAGAGPTELAKKQAESAVKRIEDRPADIAKFSLTDDKIGRMVNVIDGLLSPDGKQLTEGAARNFGSVWDAYLPNMPGGKAAVAWTDIRGLKDQLSTLAVQMAREASTTGGAYGNMTEKEWPRLESEIAALDPNMSDEQAAEKLKTIRTSLSRMQDAARKSVGSKHGENALGQRVSVRAQDLLDAPVGTMSPDGKWVKVGPDRWEEYKEGSR